MSANSNAIPGDPIQASTSLLTAQSCGVLVPATRDRTEKSSIEQSEVDDLSHPQVAGGAWVQVIPAVIAGQHLGGVARIAQGLLEVDNGVEGAALTNPRVDGLRFLISSEQTPARTHVLDAGEPTRQNEA